MQKILVTDYDNTLYLNDEQIEDNIQKIKQFINKGNIFIIATGRSYIDISKMISKYNIPFNYLICNDGGTIFDNNGKLLKKTDIPHLTAIKIFEELKRLNLLDLTYIDTGFDYSKIIDNEVNAIIIRDTGQYNATKVLKYITEKYKDVHGYISDNWINITQKTVTKSNGIEYLKNKFNFTNIYTIGDTINDINMITKFNGACMSNSTSDVLDICNKKFNSVAEYIEYIEKEEI